MCLEQTLQLQARNKRGAEVSEMLIYTQISKSFYVFIQAVNGNVLLLEHAVFLRISPCLLSRKRGRCKEQSGHDAS